MEDLFCQYLKQLETMNRILINVEERVRRGVYLYVTNDELKKCASEVEVTMIVYEKAHDFGNPMISVDDESLNKAITHFIEIWKELKGWE